MNQTVRLRHLFALCWIGFLSTTACLSQDTIVLHKGVNTFPWLYRARTLEGQPNAFVTVNSFPYVSDYPKQKLEELHDMGLDFVRIPVDPSPLVATKPEQRGAIVAQILKAVTLANNAGLTAIVDLHPRESRPGWGDRDILTSNEKRHAYGDSLVEIASSLVKGKYDRVVLEVMNEPPGGWSGSDRNFWPDIQREYVAAIRKVAPTLTLILTGAKGGGIEGLMRLSPPFAKDPHIIYSFHYYNPMVLTHQGATWTTKEYRPFLSGIAYPPAKGDEAATLDRVHNAIAKGISDPTKAAQVWAAAQVQLHDYFETAQGADRIEGDFSKVSEWAKANRISPSRILLGEFGIFRPAASETTAARYVHDVRTIAERYCFAWAFFNYQPSEKLPSFTMLHQIDTRLDGFDPGIVEDGLGLKLNH